MNEAQVRTVQQVRQVLAGTQAFMFSLKFANKFLWDAAATGRADR